MVELIKLKAPEKSRTYYYSDGTVETIYDITHFGTTKTTHRLKSSNGLLHIVASGWRRIEIDADYFTL
jgi:hypothetical protein